MNIYQRLLHLPLFQGISMDDFMQIADTMPFGFETRRKGEVVAEAGDVCRHLHFALNGKIRRIIRAQDGAFRLEEVFVAPLAIQPDRIFGLRPRYTATYISDESDTQTLSIDKNYVRDVLFGLQAFHINYLNAICTSVQVFDDRFWTRYPETILGRFVYFVGIRSMRPAGHKELFLDMNTLARELVTTRRNVSAMLNDLAARQIIILHREHIIIPHFEQLVQFVKG